MEMAQVQKIQGICWAGHTLEKPMPFSRRSGRNICINISSENDNQMGIEWKKGITEMIPGFITSTCIQRIVVYFTPEAQPKLYIHKNFSHNPKNLP